MRSLGLVVAMLAVFLVADSLFGADVRRASMRRGRLAVKGGSAAACSDCCAPCCPNLIPALVCGVENLLKCIFYCPTCSNESPKGGKGHLQRSAPCGACTIPSVRHGCCHGGGHKSSKGMWWPGNMQDPGWRGNGNSSPEVPQPSPPQEARSTRPGSRAVRMLTALRERNRKPGGQSTSRGRSRSAPRALNVTAATPIKKELRQRDSGAPDMSMIRPTSGRAAGPRIPTNPLRQP